MWSQSMDEELHLDNQTPEHKELMNRLRKTLYYGGLMMPKCKVLTQPLSDLVCSEAFIDTHPLYDWKPGTVGHIKASPCSLILAMIYLDLLKELDPQYVRRVPPSDLLLVAMMVSTKFYSGYDEDVYISEWAKYGNLDVEQLKTLEIEFLMAMDWKIYVSNETFFKKLKDIERILAERETKSRGWLTYTELCCLMPSIQVIRKAVSYSALLAVSYTAGVIALAGAFFVASHVPGSYLYERTHHPTTTTSSSDSNATTVLSETGTEATGGGSPADCRPGTTSCMVILADPHRNRSELLPTDLEQRLNNVEWEPLLSNADEDGKRIHLHRGTDYWTIEPTTTTAMDKVTSGEGPVEEMQRLAHGTIRKRENDSALWSGTMTDFEEWQPFRNNQADLGFLSYLWLKFL